MERDPHGSRQFRAARRSGDGVPLRHLLASALCLRTKAGTLRGGRAGSDAKLFLAPPGKRFFAPHRSVSGPLPLVSAGDAGATSRAVCKSRCHGGQRMIDQTRKPIDLVSSNWIARLTELWPSWSAFRKDRSAGNSFWPALHPFFLPSPFKRIPAGPVFG